ncbi:hypothetical protein G7067_12465 [Leucobacter insecticola]|uniref:Uncharacterized protein n=1 Tax=Leucobacter insecticola TaxID=2714934 RepID=A0A6G8FKM3_9MICO|nr:SpaA isopeptide-forming pilin-related protein [Leucobacter insecticola]QIM17030.1 hypothetical protein G7067_12465 [Leucobacter insecticola]
MQNLPYGTYTITEIYQPDGYALSAAPTTVTVASGSENATVSVSHTRGANLPYGDTFSPDLDVKITADTDLAAYAGQVITFTIDITNTGNTVLNGFDAGFHRFSASSDVKDNPYNDLPGSPTANSSISDDYIKSIDGCVSQRFLAPGESVSCQVQYAVAEADLHWASNRDANDDYDLTCTIMFSDWFTAWDRYNTQFNQTTATGENLRENPATYETRNRVVNGDTIQIRTPCYREPTQQADDAILEINNSLSGDGADEAQGPFIVEVDCVINGTSLPGFPRTVIFDSPGSQQITVEAGATCRLTSIDRGNASGASITTNDVVMESGKTASVTVDHVFGSSTVPPSGSAVLPAQGGNQGPAGAAASAGSADSQSEQTLAVTGAPIAAYLSAGSIATLLGGALLIAVRRRPPLSFRVSRCQ